MADFSLTTLFVVPVGNSLPSAGSTQDLAAGQVGIFKADYTVANAGNIQTNNKYFYIAQGRTNTYLQGSKRSDKISATGSNVTEWYKVEGNATATTQITEVSGWNVTPGTDVTITLRAHSSYIDTLYFNGFTRSVTVKGACLECGGDPCAQVDHEALVDEFIAKFEQAAPGNNPDNISFNTFFEFSRSGSGQNSVLVIEGKPLTVYGQPCDVAAFPYEYDRMYFRTFAYAGPATTADFIVADSCNIVAESLITQHATYPTGSSAEIAQLEKNYYSYQAGYLKHLYRMAGYNENFESWVSAGTTYDTYYIRFNSLDQSTYQWGDYIHQDAFVIIAAPTGGVATAIETVLAAALGTPTDETAGTPTPNPLVP
jgi:hypothetical protein